MVLLSIAAKQTGSSGAGLPGPPHVHPVARSLIAAPRRVVPGSLLLALFYYFHLAQSLHLTLTQTSAVARILAQFLPPFLLLSALPWTAPLGAFQMQTWAPALSNTVLPPHLEEPCPPYPALGSLLGSPHSMPLVTSLHLLMPSSPLPRMLSPLLVTWFPQAHPCRFRTRLPRLGKWALTRPSSMCPLSMGLLAITALTTLTSCLLGGPDSPITQHLSEVRA